MYCQFYMSINFLFFLLQNYNLHPQLVRFFLVLFGAGKGVGEE